MNLRLAVFSNRFQSSIFSQCQRHLGERVSVWKRQGDVHTQYRTLSIEQSHLSSFPMIRGQNSPMWFGSRCVCPTSQDLFTSYGHQINQHSPWNFLHTWQELSPQWFASRLFFLLMIFQAPSAVGWFSSTRFLFNLYNLFETARQGRQLNLGNGQHLTSFQLQLYC